jgi:fructose/tagatose bisphosphate aldolase
MTPYRSVDEMSSGLQSVATVMPDRVEVTRAGAIPGDVIDRLTWTAVFGADPGLRGTARWVIRSLAAAEGIRAASIHDLYMALGRRDIGGFTVPAINVRMMAYDTGRALMRTARKLDVGAFILEIARSEVGYTEQRPAEYAAVMTAAALREGFRGPLFIQADHVQVNAKKYAGADREKELDTIRKLIVEEIEAGFYNIDIDTSTLVDLSKETLPEQQRANYELAAEFTRLIRDRQPKGVTISVGGEIGEVGGKNSDVHELRAFMEGYNRCRGGDVVGISKISVQTGTAHGGFVMPDGTVRSDVKIDLDTLAQLSKVAREEYGMAGAVQHGASTLPPDAFDAFPRVGACEIHLATDFQNMIYEHAKFPKALKDEMYAWLQEHAADERKPSDTEGQFFYKSRKKAIGPFKQRVWSLPEDVRAEIAASLEERFAFLLKQLKVNSTSEAVARWIRPVQTPIDRAQEVAAAGGQITASERKAEGLAD